MQVAELETQLNNFDPGVRETALRELIALAGAGAVELPPPVEQPDAIEDRRDALAALLAREPVQAPLELAHLLDAVLAGEPTCLRARYARGLVLSESGDREGAVAAWRRALELRPGDPMATNYLKANGALYEGN